MAGAPTRRSLLATLPTTMFGAGCIGGLTGEQDPEERAIGFYAKGAQTVQNGCVHLEDALRAYENEEWVFVTSDSATAEELFSRAVDQFETAADLAGELDNQGARDISDDAAQKSTVLREAASHLQKTGQARQNGDSERATKHYDRSQAALDRAEQYQIRDVSVIEGEFGR